LALIVVAAPASAQDLVEKFHRERTLSIVIGLGGSISAEHGIGLSKREELRRYRTTTELDVMARIKSALDPDRIMNPGKLLTL
jgi:FAD/FMN-containing dehydrogenase